MAGSITDLYRTIYSEKQRREIESGNLKTSSGGLPINDKGHLSDTSPYTSGVTSQTQSEVNRYLKDNPGTNLAGGEGYVQVNTINGQRYNAAGAGDGAGYKAESYAIPIYGKMPAQASAAAPATQQMANPASAQEAVDRANQYKAEAGRIQGELKNQPVPELNYTPGVWDAAAGSYTDGNGVGAVAKLAADVGRQGQAYTSLMHDRAKNSQDIASNFLEQFAYTLPKVPEEDDDDSMIARAKEYASIFKA